MLITSTMTSQHQKIQIAIWPNNWAPSLDPGKINLMFSGCGRGLRHAPRQRSVSWEAMPACVPCGLRRVRLFVTLWTVAHRAPLSREFSRQEYWSGLPFSSPGDLPDPGIKPKSPALAGRFFTTEPLGKPFLACTTLIIKTSGQGYD